MAVVIIAVALGDGGDGGRQDPGQSGYGSSVAASVLTVTMGGVCMEVVVVGMCVVVVVVTIVFGVVVIVAGVVFGALVLVQVCL